MSANQSAKGFCITAGGPPYDPKAVLAKQLLISQENSNALAGTLKHSKWSEVQGPLQPWPHRPCYLFKQQVVPISPLFVSVASSNGWGGFSHTLHRSKRALKYVCFPRMELDGKKNTHFQDVPEYYHFHSFFVPELKVMLIS